MRARAERRAGHSPWRRDEPLAVVFLLAGLALGIGAGLLVAWVISPVRYVDTQPFSLRADFKDQYRAMIAAAYNADGDVGRARSRLGQLADPDPVTALGVQAQQPGLAADEARRLVALAAALKQDTSGESAQQTVSALLKAQAATLAVEKQTRAASQAAGQVTASLTTSTVTPTRRAATATRAITRTATPTPTPEEPLPTPLPSPTPGAPFEFVSREPVCGLAFPLLQVQVNDAAGSGAAGIEIVVAWEGGEDSFFTGFSPTNPGYADFRMTPGTVYSLRLADGGQPLTNLYAPGCPGGQAGSLLITFAQK